MRGLAATAAHVGSLTAAGLLVALLFASSGQAAGGKVKTLRIFEKAVSIRLSKPDGTVLEKLPIAEPKPGDVLDLVFDDFVGNHRRHAKQRSATDHLHCTFVAAGPPNCVSHVAFGSSMLVIEGNPGRVVLGTGKYRGATGRVVSAKEVRHAPPSSLAHNDIDIVARVRLK